MASIEQLAKGYADRIRLARDKRWETQRVLKEIENLVYADTKQPIINASKLILLETLQRELQGYLPYGFGYIEKSENENHLALISHMIELLKK